MLSIFSMLSVEVAPLTKVEDEEVRRGELLSPISVSSFISCNRRNIEYSIEMHNEKRRGSSSTKK